jgi:F-type H+-transporting ATPase subunit delta
MGVLANHVPSIEQLKPGLVEVIEESGGSKQFFRTSTQAHPQFSELILNAVSGGFAIVQPNSELSINAVEGFPLEDFSIENVRSQLSEAQKIAGGSGSEADIAEAKIEIEVSLYTRMFSGELSNDLLGVGELAGRSQVKVHPWFW